MDSSQDIDIKVLTLNVRGIKSNKKRKCVFNWLRKTADADIIFLQETYVDKKLGKRIETEWNGLKYHNYTDSNHSRGVSVLFKSKLDVQILDCKTCSEGRCLLLNVKIDNQHYCLVNIYAPNDVASRINFFKRTQKWIKENSKTDTHIIIAGDCNSIDDKRDRASGHLGRCAKHFTDFKYFNGVCDIWRKQNPDAVEYTFIDPGNVRNGSRIDYILLSEYLSSSTQNAYITNAPVPDHKAVVLHLTGTTRKRGTSYWKINNSILSDQAYQCEIRKIFNETVNDYSGHACLRDIWDLCKIRFKEYSIVTSIKRAKQQKCEARHLQQKLDNIDTLIASGSITNPELNEARRTIKAEFDRLSMEKAIGAQIRSKARWTEDGERNTAYFLGLESSRQVNSTINALKDKSCNK